MRILYGIQGTGNGHLARARALVPALRAAGIDLDFVLSGRAPEDYFNMELFEGYACYRGLSLMTQGGRLKHWQTLTRNNAFQFIGDAGSLNLDRYELVISDFEPVTAWAARFSETPSIGISHQHAFDYRVPRVRGHLSARALLKTFAPSNRRVGLHWHHFQQPLLPPLIEAMHPEPVVDDKILVYMGFEALADVVAFLKPFDNYRFLVYAQVPQEYHSGHIWVKPLSHSEFHRDLLDCAGVISNAGFELASECLALGKKLLIKPLLGQYEQLCNALALQALHRATVIDRLESATLAKWLELPGHAGIRYPDVAAVLADWIRHGRELSLPELASSLWDDCDFPFHYDEGFGRSLRPGLIL